jgi:hypothetical protein
VPATPPPAWTAGRGPGQTWLNWRGDGEREQWLVCFRYIGLQSRRTRTKGNALAVPRAQYRADRRCTRARWDAWLAQMPVEPRAALIHRLKGRNDDHVRAALAELVTFVLLGAA